MTLLAACVRREFEIDKLNNGHAFFGTSLGSLNNKHAFFGKIISNELLVSQDQASTLSRLPRLFVRLRHTQHGKKHYMCFSLG